MPKTEEELLGVLTEEEAKALGNMGGKLCDPDLLSVPNKPVFCVTNSGMWRVFEQDTITQMLESNRTYRSRIKEISESGPTGIGYYLSHLEGNEPELTQALNNVLLAWNRHFPLEEYNQKVTDNEMREVLSRHERWLDNTDHFMDRAIWSLLPYQVRQEPDLRRELAEEQRRLAEMTKLTEELVALRENRDILQRERTPRVSLMDDKTTPITDLRRQENEDRLTEINQELADLNKKIAQHEDTIAGYGTRESILEEIEIIDFTLQECIVYKGEFDIASLIIAALEQVEVTSVVNRESNTPESVLLNFDKDDEDCVLTEGQLVALVKQAADALKERGYTQLQLDKDGPLRQYLNSSREKQEDDYTNASKSLCTEPVKVRIERKEVDNTSTKDVLCTEVESYEYQSHNITEGLVRDPFDRTCYIDTRAGVDGSDFRDIIIGGCLWQSQNTSFVLPENIKDYIAARASEGSMYEANVKRKFFGYRNGNLKLPEEQVRALSCIKLRKDRFDLLPGQGQFAVKQTSGVGSHEEVLSNSLT